MYNTNNIIFDELNLSEKIKNFKEGGASKIHIISDFDKTLTYGKVNGKDTPSMVSILRIKNILGDEYTKKAYELFDYYNPIEIDPNIPLDIKKREMYIWWKKHIDLLVQTGVNKRDIAKILDSGLILLRKGVNEFLYKLNKNDIPFIIISANPFGYDTIGKYLENEKSLFKNIFIESNGFLWDKNGKAIGVKNNIVHIFNKDETILEDNPIIYDKIKNKKNVILIGDSLGDILMIEGFDYDNLIKIGFLNKNYEENIKKYKEVYDIVILNDGDFDFINDLLDRII